MDEKQNEDVSEAPVPEDTPVEPEAPESTSEGVSGDVSEPAGDNDSGQVSKLRDEAAKHRVRARDAEAQNAALQEQIFGLLVQLDGRLADPADLPYADGMATPEGVAAAIAQLLEAKPHFAARKPAALPEQSVAQEAPAGSTFSEWLRG